MLGKLRLKVSFLWNISLRCEQQSLPSFGLGEGRMSGSFPLLPLTQGGQSCQAHSLLPSLQSPGACCHPSSIAGSSALVGWVTEKQNLRTWFLDPTGNRKCPWLSPAGPSRVLPHGLDPVAGTHLVQVGLGWEQGPLSPGPPAGGLHCMLPSSCLCPPVCPEQSSGS